MHDRIPGIWGNVDRDAFYCAKQQWEAFLREPGGRSVQTGAAEPASAPRQPTQTAAAEPREFQASAPEAAQELEPVAEPPSERVQ